MPVPTRLATTLTLGSALACTLLAACGHNQDVQIQKSSADTAAMGTPVGSMKPTMDSGLAAGNKTLDSLHGAGVGTKNGLDSVGSKVQATTRNEPGHDTSRINNRATPGAGPAAPAGSAPGATRP